MKFPALTLTVWSFAVGGAVAQLPPLERAPAATSWGAEVSDLAAALARLDSEARADNARKQFEETFGVPPERVAGSAEGPVQRFEVVRQGEALPLLRWSDDNGDQFAEGLGAAEPADDGGVAYALATNPPAFAARRGSLWALSPDKQLALEGVLPADSLAEAPDGVLEAEKLDTSAETKGPAGGAPELSTRWWADPWATLRLRVEAGTATSDEEDAYRYAVRHGLTGIRGVAAAASLGDANSTTGSVSLAAPASREHSLRLMTTSPTRDLRVPEWLAPIEGRFTLLHADVPLAFARMDRVFDDLLAEGIDGTYRELLADLADEAGLGIDLEKELYPLLGPQVCLATENTDSPGEVAAALFVFDATDAAAVADALRVLMQDDEEASFVRWSEGASGWRVASEKGPDPCLATVDRYAVYATDVAFLERALVEASPERRRSFTDFNERLAELTRQNPASMSMVSTDVPSGNDAASTARVLATFFSGPESIAPEKKDLAGKFLDDVSQMIVDPIILGYDHPGGWRFVGSRGVGAADPVATE